MTRSRKATLLGIAAVAGGLAWWYLTAEPPPAAPLPAAQARKEARPRFSLRRKPVVPARPAETAPVAQRPRVEVLPPEELLETTPTPTADPRSIVTVHVVEADGSPVRGAQVVSRDCDVWRLARGGVTTVYLRGDQTCAIRGGRQDGALMAWSEEEIVEGGEDDELWLEVPAQKTAGLGISIAEDENGVLVRHIFPGSPAADVGIRAGDVIVEVEGADTVDMTLDDFISRATGPEGSEVEIVVGSGTDDDWTERRLTVTRRAIGRPRG